MHFRFAAMAMAIAFLGAGTAMADVRDGTAGLTQFKPIEAPGNDGFRAQTGPANALLLAKKDEKGKHHYDKDKCPYCKSGKDKKAKAHGDKKAKGKGCQCETCRAKKMAKKHDDKSHHGKEKACPHCGVKKKTKHDDHDKGKKEGKCPDCGGKKDAKCHGGKKLAKKHGDDKGYHAKKAHKDKKCAHCGAKKSHDDKGRHAEKKRHDGGKDKAYFHHTEGKSVHDLLKKVVAASKHHDDVTVVVIVNTDDDD